MVLRDTHFGDPCIFPIFLGHDGVRRAPRMCRHGFAVSDAIVPNLVLVYCNL